MRTKYLRPLYALHIRWCIHDGLDIFFDFKHIEHVERMPLDAARARAVALAMIHERKIERAWLVIQDRGNRTSREASWMVEAYITGAVRSRGILRALQADNHDLAKIVPLIGD